MKKLLKMIIASLATALLLAGLFACQPASAPMGQIDSLNPDQRSTGDPPLIPHDIDQADGNDVCQDCHRTGEMGAPKYPQWHASLVDCQQCHVPETEGAQTFKTDY